MRSGRAARDARPEREGHVDIRETGDRLAIMELLARCARGVDTRARALWRDVRDITVMNHIRLLTAYRDLETAAALADLP